MIIKNDADLVYPYTYDSSNLHGNADAVYIPSNLEELQEAVKQCYENNIKITISGAGTGITGSRVPSGGVVISTELLKKVIKIENNIATIEPGITLDELDKYLEDYDLFLPPNPTEKNASIGGNIATNASGARTFKYGSIRNYINKLTIILPDGDLLKLERGTSNLALNTYPQGEGPKNTNSESFLKLSISEKAEVGLLENSNLTLKEGFENTYLETFLKPSLVGQVGEGLSGLILTTESGKSIELSLPDYKMPEVKNASGYYIKSGMDAIDLFIGSEGTLGVFGEIELKLLPRPNNILGGVIFFDDIQKLLDFVIKLRDTSKINNKIDVNFNNNISARLIEFFDKQSLELLRPKYSQIHENAIGAIWFEQEYSKEFEDEIMAEWYELIKSNTCLADSTWFAMNDKEHENLKEFRHELPLQIYENLTNNSQQKVGLDTAVPDESFPILFNYYLENFPNLNLQYVVFGHIGNSHLHANIFCQNDDEYKKAVLFYNKCIDLTLSLNGTVSAEHGIGKLKKKYLLKMYGINSVNSMKQIKMLFDTKYLLGVGTMFD
jgi:FAD/FMN-containing dehydrogenase